ncbi:MAG: hypothetical protein GX575_23650 [Candidatus Anammoximicrobium sp.]|mgnify:CR=1 FL=1|nr:hypothetical protein [Candidatus Anammoximicrobium sp.]
MAAPMRFLWFTALLCLSASGLSADPSADADGKGKGFVRLRTGEDQVPLALETAIVRFAATTDRGRGVQVDLVGAIHIGDKAYYEELNRRFLGYDAVLYELVAREDANVPRAGQSPGSVVGGMQVGMKSLLHLEYQLDCIDYGRQNMVHADMSPEEFAATMKRRNESFAAMFFRLLGRSMAEQAEDRLGTNDVQMLAALFAPDRAPRLKRLMAKEFADLEGEISIFDGPEGSTIITERNKKALEVLRREIARGHKKLAVFYGAGHLPDMQRRLQEEFAMQRTGTEWLAAWSLTDGR